MNYIKDDTKSIYKATEHIIIYYLCIRFMHILCYSKDIYYSHCESQKNNLKQIQLISF